MPTTRAMAKAGGSNAVQSEQNKPPPRKKVKVAKTTTSSSKRRVKLSLARLLDLPPEIFTEIAIYLLPADLLSLARSNKFFRKLFMSRASQRLWKTAIRNVSDMPDCPPELSEPQYVSLLYSKTCSSCGARVLRQMDPYLLVRLCNTCRDKEIQVLYMFDPVYPLVPRSDLMKTPEHGIIYTFKSEYREVMARPEREDEESQWYKDRTEEIYKRQTRGEDLEDFMNMLEDERDAELDELRMQRWRQIKELVSEDGWTNRDMFPSPDNRAEWRKLVGQPKPITDRIWANLYPKLLPLLKSNREYNERIDKEARRRKRITMLQNMAEHMRAALPPLVHVTMKHPPQPQSPTPSTSSAPTAPAGYYPDVKVEFPFPTIAELATWPMIKHILDDDTSPEETETKFTAIRDDVDRMVREWRDKIEQDLIEIWNIGRDGVRGQKLEQSKSKGKGKRTAVKKTTKRETRSSKGKATAETELAMPSLPTAELVIPEFTVTFARPDGTTTTNLSDLPPNLQLLLRADTIFAGEVIEHSYPGIVPRFLSSGAHFGCASSMCHGQRWDSNKFTRDDDCSALAKLMLARMGRPDATSAEMKALRGNLSCGRCNSGWPDTWDYLLSHYHKEQLQWKLGQTIIQAKPQAGFVYANTHDLGPGNDKIFARFTTPQESAQHLLLSTVSNMPMMRCLKCDEMGIDARYFHTYHGEQESPIAEHLRDVHNVMQALPGLHFRRWEYDIDFYDPWAEEEDDFDSDMEDEFWDMID